MGRPRIRILNVERPAHETYLDELVAGMSALGYAERSSAAHYWTARRFLDWTGKHGAGRIEATTSAQLEVYREHVKNMLSLKDGGPVSEKIVYQNLRTVQLLFDHLLSAGIITIDPFSTFKMSQPKRGAARPILTRNEVAEMYAACEEPAERALLALTYGLRLAGGRVGAAERGRSAVG
jgi:site-specific recombinase XerD